MKGISTFRFFSLFATTIGLALSVTASEPTAFSLISEGNRHVGEMSKDKVVQIRSERSVGGLVPQIWYVVYYDRTATFKATEVKFGSGKMIDVKRPFRVLEQITGDDKILDRDKLKVDSDRALDIAKKEPLLKDLKLTNAQFWLQRDDEGPVWRIRLWAEKLRHPSDSAHVGDLYISAETGKVVRNDLHIERVD
jgi:hypothetical protein